MFSVLCTIYNFQDEFLFQELKKCGFDDSHFVHFDDKLYLLLLVEYRNSVDPSNGLAYIIIVMDQYAVCVFRRLLITFYTVCNSN